MVYLIIRHSGEYEDRCTEVVSYSANKELAETTLFRLNDQREKFKHSLTKIQDLDVGFEPHIDSFYYVIETVNEISSNYIEVEYGKEE